jgi:hypothetical protein
MAIGYEAKVLVEEREHMVLESIGDVAARSRNWP